MSAYDVIVIGRGAPGEHCAAALAAGGLHVALVGRALVGGARLEIEAAVIRTVYVQHQAARRETPRAGEILLCGREGLRLPSFAAYQPLH